MTFDDIPAGVTVFLDANTLIYHFTAHAGYGAACTSLLDRIERQEISGASSAHVLSDVAHRLMTIEAMTRLGWPATRLAARLRQHHAEIPRLSLYRQALTRVAQMGIIVFPISEHLVHGAAGLSQQHELLTDDALIVAAMQAHNLIRVPSR
jgi:predicted nucleic acid-binding protein